MQKRPERLKCDVYNITIEERRKKEIDWMIFIGILNKKPYEIFIGATDDMALPKRINKGEIVKSDSGVYGFGFDDEILIKNINKLFSNDYQETLSRQIALNMQSGTDLQKIIKQLKKSKEKINVKIANILEKYIDSETGNS